MTDPAGNTSTFAYDLGRVLSETSVPGERSYEYDLADRMTESTGHEGRVRECDDARIGPFTDESL